MDSHSLFKENISKKKDHQAFSDFCIVNSHSYLPEDALFLIGPRTYRLVGHGENVRFFISGCGGDALGQQQVAECMDQTAKKEGAPDFVLVLGDNIYENGADSPNDPAFNTYFHDVYPHLKHMQGVPYYLILGNHDGKYHKKASLTKKLTSNIKQGREVEKNEVIHTYVTDGFGTTEEKIRLYSQPELNLKKAPHWNMPNFYYSLIIGDTQVFCINSNSYPKDYLTLINDMPDKDNQAVWLLTEYRKAKAEGRKTILALHHPLHTEGKRIDPQEFDAYHYLTYEEINNLNTCLGANTQSYNELLKKIFITQDMHFDVIAAAHDHYLSYYNNAANHEDPYKICQIKAGGGGGKLQKRVAALDHPNVYCLEKHGFAAISFTAKQPVSFDIDIYSIDGHHLRFNNQHHQPIQAMPDPETKQLQEYVLAACNEYLYLLKQEELQQEMLAQHSPQRNDYIAMLSYFVSSVSAWMRYIRPYPVKINEMAAADDLIAYFSQVTLPHINDLYEYVSKSIDNEKLKAIFTYLKKYEKDQIIDLQFENSFFFMLFKKLISMPDGMGDKIKNRWQLLIDVLTKTAPNMVV